jgi:hypothetical protein
MILSLKMKRKTFKIFRSAGINYVVTISRQAGEHANFMNTGFALSGILRNNETIDSFASRRLLATELHEKQNETLYKVIQTTRWRQRIKNTK